MRHQALLGLAWLAGAATAAGAPSDTSSDGLQTQASDIIPGAYMVEFEDGQDDEAALFNQLRGSGLNATKRLGLKYSLFKGASIQLDGSATELEPSEAHMRIASVPVVKKVWPVRRIPRPISTVVNSTGVSPETVSNGLKRRGDANDTYVPHTMMQIDQLHNAGYTGKGVRIAIIDSGVDYHHPALGGCFGPGCPISFGGDLVGDSYDGSNDPTPDDDPWTECDAHGTHVSGIVSALENDMGFVGAAPGAEVGMYRVFGCSGDTSTDVMVAAFNRAYEDGADVITASIGGNVGWPEEAFAAGVTRIVDAGVPCTLAAGNDGSRGLFYASSAAEGYRVSAVASAESEEHALALVAAEAVVDGVSTKFGWKDGATPMGNLSLPLWVVTPNDTVDGSWSMCADLKDDTVDLTGKIALVEYGSCGTWAAMNYLSNRGAEYVLVYYTADESFLFRTPCSNFDNLKGCAMIPVPSALELREKFVNGSSVEITMTEAQYAEPIAVRWPNTVSGGYMDGFTSWGPTYELDLVPTFAAVGGSIISTFPLSQGAYMVESGTSMATPLMASIYALVMEARGEKDPNVLRSLFSATAEPKRFFDGKTAQEGLASVAQQGGGMVQAYKAAFATTLLDVTSLAFNDSANFVGSASFTIKNTAEEEVTYQLGHAPALTMYTFQEGRALPALFPNPVAEEQATLAFSADSVTVPAGGSVSVTVTPTPPSGLNKDLLPVYSGYITVNGTTGEDLILPYLGVVGSMYDQPIVDPDFCFLINNTIYPYEPVAANTSWTLPYPTKAVVPQTYPLSDYPALVLQITMGTELLRVDVEPLGDTAANVTTTDVFGTKSAGSLGGFPLEWVPRAHWIASYPGMTQEGTVLPPGTYRLVVRLLRIFGDRNNADDYIVKPLQPFSIRYQDSA